VIRAAGPDDAEAIHELVRLLAEYEREPDAVVTTVETIRTDLSAPHPPFECLLAEDDGRALGFALFHETYSTWTGRALYLEDFFVREDARGGGIGKALFRRVVQLAVERGYRRLDLSVLNWNTSAIDFCAAHGGLPVDDWTRFRFERGALVRIGSDAS
jgi:GNAT superfamily N-acetyltransferase